jgi:hypothetical protein
MGRLSGAEIARAVKGAALGVVLGLVMAAMARSRSA